MKAIIITLFTALFAFSAKADIINVCGTDSITLTVENYVNGTIEWQESIDTINWATIPEVSGLTYTFFPTQTKYYRAVVKTSYCPPLYSAISLVQLAPIANAGTDRIIGGSNMKLLANTIPGTIGEWAILSGSSGIIDDPFNPNAIFSGVNKECYLLKWTLTNACGQSSDTLAITFDEINTKTNYIVVDNTDSILSDSTEIVKGIYRIKFSDTSISPSDSAILVGMRKDISFLQKVNAFTFQDSIYTFITSQGTLDDLIISGSLNLGDAINQSFNVESSYLRSSIVSGPILINVFPTRETLKKLNSNKDIILIYSGPLYDTEGSKLRSTSVTSENNGLQINLPDIHLFEKLDKNFSMTFKNSYIRINPNFVFDRKITWLPLSLDYLKLGVDNGEFEFNIETNLTAKFPIDFVAIRKSVLPKPFLKQIIVMAGGTPIPILISIDVIAEGRIGVTSEMLLDHINNYKFIMSALLEKSKGEEISYKHNVEEYSTSNAKLNLLGELGSEFHIGPEISFRIFNFFGPYLNLAAKVDLDICTSNNPNGQNHWQANGSIGFDGTFGVDAKIYDWTLPCFSKPIFSDAARKSVTFPYKLEYLSGNYQSGVSSDMLSKPITFKVLSSDSKFGVPFVPVKFETGINDGSVDEEVQYTDSKGEVSTNWRLGTNPKNTLMVRVLDCMNSDIENSPYYIYAYTSTQSNDCLNCSLDISMITSNGFTLPSVSGGTPPYTYSINGVDFNSTIPQFSISIPGSKTVYVKDNKKCTQNRSFYIKPNLECASSNLAIDIFMQPDIIKLTGENGTKPYLYAIDNTSSFSTINTYSNLSSGKHIAYVKDAQGCVFSKEVQIESIINSSIVATYPVNGAVSTPFSNMKFQWSAGNYATNQVYDIYLKKGSEAYSLIASNLSTISYTYTTTLSNSSNYTWKLTVKSSDGIVIDYNEFLFTTASGVVTTPTAPALLQPENGATVYFPVTLNWTAQAGDFKYDLYLDSNNASKLIANNLSSAEYTVNNLTSGQTYYWKVKIKSTITGATALSAVRSFTTRQGTGETVTDIDGNVYHTIKIGTQTWLLENLRTTRYRNGEAIGTTTPATKDIRSESSPKYQWAYNGDESNASKYGRLYTGYAVADSRNIAPVGWHVPTDAEWTTLENYLIANGFNYDGTTTYNRLSKSLAATTDWATCSYYGAIGNDLTKNNSSGFTALPGGYRHYFGPFDGVGSYGYWWSSTESVTTLAWYRTLAYGNSFPGRGDDSKSWGYSVRCIRDEILSIATIVTTNITTSITTNSATSGGTIISNGGATITASGVCWSTSATPTTANSKTTDGSTTGSFTSALTGLLSGTTYYVRAYAKNSIGTAYGNQVSFTTTGTITDIDGNLYHAVTIGTQVWMAENLKTTKYNDGTSIPLISDSNEWSKTSTLGYCFQNNDVANKNIYGALYNHNTVKTGKLAPAGWHVPTDVEWNTLENYLIANRYNYNGTTSNNGIAKSLAATTGWSISTNTGAIGNDLTKNNTSGFAALPGGFRFGNGTFGGSIGGLGIWWSFDGYSRLLYYYFNYLTSGGYYSGSWGLSVRCVKDDDSKINFATVNIPAGTFKMGSPTTEVSRNSDETQHNFLEKE